MIEKTKLLMITDYKYPCTHAVMEKVFSKEIAKYVEVLWIMQGDFNNLLKWNNSEIIIVKKLNGKGRIVGIINRLLWIKTIFKIYQLTKKNDFDILLVRDLPLIVVMAYLLTFKLKFKLYYQYSAPHGDISIDRFYSLKGIKRILFLAKGKMHNLTNRLAFRFSDLIFPISESHKKEISNNRIKAEKLIPLTMGVDAKWANNIPRRIDFLQNQKGNELWITYVGSLGLLRKPEFMLNVINELHNDSILCKLVLIGSAANKEDLLELKSIAEQMKINNNLLFVGKVDRKILQKYLWYSDICISPIPPTSYYNISSPTKLYEYMGHGIPVVANEEVYEQKKVIEESEGGVSVKYEVGEFVGAIKKLIEDNELRKIMSIKGKNYILNNYSYEKISKDLLPYFCIK